jgi:hypothetical protein
MAFKYSKWPHNIPTLTIKRPSKIYPNWDFWFENKPSGNPVILGGKRRQYQNRFLLPENLTTSNKGAVLLVVGSM